MNRGEIERKIAQGLAYIDPKTGKPWYDEPERSILGCLFRQFVRRSACAIRSGGSHVQTKLLVILRVFLFGIFTSLVSQLL